MVGWDQITVALPSPSEVPLGTTAITVPPWGLGQPPQLGLGDVLSVGLHQNLPMVFGMGYLLNDFIPVFL